MEIKNANGEQTLQRMPVTYTSELFAAKGIEEYARAIEDTIFWLVDNSTKQLMMLILCRAGIIFSAKIHPLDVSFLYKDM